MDYIVTLNTPEGEEHALSFCFGPFPDFSSAFDFRDKLTLSSAIPNNWCAVVRVLNPPEHQNIRDLHRIMPALKTG